jgi:hypothetical protein
MGRETLDGLARAQGSRPTVAKVRAAIERLRRAGLLVKAGPGPTAVDDPLFAEYLQSKSLDQLKLLGPGLAFTEMRRQHRGHPASHACHKREAASVRCPVVRRSSPTGQGTACRARVGQLTRHHMAGSKPSASCFAPRPWNSSARPLRVCRDKRTIPSTGLRCGVPAHPLARGGRVRGDNACESLPSAAPFAAL